MKQTLEEAARKYADANCWIPEELHDSEIPDYIEHFAKHFIAGAEWHAKQSPWISVKDRLPEENTSVFFAVKWKDLHRGYFVGLYYGNGQWESDHRIFLPDSPLGCITHWMPIPSFDEILEANRDVLERIKEKGD